MAYFYFVTLHSNGIFRVQLYIFVLFDRIVSQSAVTQSAKPKSLHAINGKVRNTRALFATNVAPNMTHARKKTRVTKVYLSFFVLCYCWLAIRKQREGENGITNSMNRMTCELRAEVIPYNIFFLITIVRAQ